jgi:hypothetical protein
MKAAAKGKAKPKKEVNPDPLRMLKHDINNQLSNIYLALEQLRYELPDASADCIFYLDSIGMSSERIHAILQETE